MTRRVATMALPDGAGPDFSALRRRRRLRLLDAMAVNGLDALVLGRPANIAYASGARQLWTSGSRPFAPGCVVTADDGAVHLLSISDDGIPDEIGRDGLYGMAWNPANLVVSLQAIKGLAAAKRVGTDSATPTFPAMLASVAPGAELTDGRPAIWSARTTKSPDEVACITTATAIAESALVAMVDAARPGITERQLVGRYFEAIASTGTATPPTEAVVCATARSGPVILRRVVTDGAVEPGQLVVLDPGAMYAGYEGGVGRTIVAGSTPTPRQLSLATRCRDALDALVAACRAGAAGHEIKAAWAATGEAMPIAALVHGVGLGMEPPVIGGGGGDDAVLSADMVVSVTAWVAEDGVGGWLGRDIVHVTSDGPAVLSRSSHAAARS
ncbi:MAG TPA: M24 family metallopeptidase [Acidimicrobiales bacterium]|nr:M24 family metallopeptidase [Acidimicrobiales bacterium]